jgi:methionyl-tRNA formyltransferase
MSNLKIVFVAFSENSLGRRILNGLVSKGKIPICTFMASETAKKEFRKKGIKRYIKNNGIFNTIWRIYYRLTIRKDVRKESVNHNNILKKSIKEVCASNEIQIIYFDDINNINLVNKLKQLNPDLIILGGAPLIKKQIIEIPKIAVLNSHPGILPFAKGMDVVSQSIIDSIPLGVTVFKVDEGMDSGPVLLKKYFEKEVYGLKLYEIESMIEELSSNAMLEAVEIIEKGDFHFENQIEKGHIYKALNYQKYNEVRKILNSKI